jgi:hypothetical protein
MKKKESNEEMLTSGESNIQNQEHITQEKTISRQDAENVKPIHHSKSKEIDHVIIFYKDDTFKAYKPEFNS